MVKSNLTGLQIQNRECLIKIISCLHHLTREGVHLRGHWNDQSFKQHLYFCAEDDPVIWLNRKNWND